MACLFSLIHYLSTPTAADHRAALCYPPRNVLCITPYRRGISRSERRSEGGVKNKVNLE